MFLVARHILYNHCNESIGVFRHGIEGVQFAFSVDKIHFYFPYHFLFSYISNE